MMNDISEQPVGQVVADDYRAAQVFRAHGVDFCCGGKKSLGEVCRNKNIKLDTVLEDLKNLKQSGEEQNNYSEWSLDFLADYIVQNHHNYVRKMLPELEFYAEKVARVHGGHHPELLEVLKNIKILSYELTEHLEKEEEDLFPQIKKLVQEKKAGTVKDALLEVLEDEHERVGELMANIEFLTDGFTPPDDACASYKVLFQNLEGFQKDLHKHVHLENNILFPKALAFEKRMN